MMTAGRNKYETVCPELLVYILADPSVMAVIALRNWSGGDVASFYKDGLIAAKLGEKGIDLSDQEALTKFNKYFQVKRQDAKEKCAEVQAEMEKMRSDRSYELKVLREMMNDHPPLVNSSGTIGAELGAGQQGQNGRGGSSGSDAGAAAGVSATGTNRGTVPPRRLLTDGSNEQPDFIPPTPRGDDNEYALSRPRAHATPSNNFEGCTVVFNDGNAPIVLGSPAPSRRRSEWEDEMTEAVRSLNLQVSRGTEAVEDISDRQRNLQRSVNGMRSGQESISNVLGGIQTEQDASQRTLADMQETQQRMEGRQREMDHRQHYMAASTASKVITGMVRLQRGGQPSAPLEAAARHAARGGGVAPAPAVNGGAAPAASAVLAEVGTRGGGGGGGAPASHGNQVSFDPNLVSDTGLVDYVDPALKQQDGEEEEKKEEPEEDDRKPAARETAAPATSRRQSSRRAAAARTPRRPTLPVAPRTPRRATPRASTARSAGKQPHHLEKLKQKMEKDREEEEARKKYLETPVRTRRQKREEEEAAKKAAK